jgi:uncharacterized integral membrane protein
LGWHNIGTNIKYGVLCYFGSSNEVIPESCSNVHWLVTLYIILTIIILFAIEKILEIDCEVLSRSMFASVIVAYIGAFLFGIYENVSISIFDFISIAMLLYGMLLFGSDPEPTVQLLNSGSPVAAESH